MPAGEEGAHRIEQLAPAVQQAHGRAERLVTGPGVEVGVDLTHVERQLGHRLRAVDEADRAGGPDAPRHLGDRVDRAEHIRHVRERRQLDPSLGQHLVELVERELALLVDLQVAEPGALLLAEDLPGHDVRVVLHVGDEHLVALAHVVATPGVGDQVDRLGRVAGEDGALGVPAHELGDPLTGRLEQLGRLARQLVHAAMDRRVGVALEAVHCLDHLARALRGGGGVEVGDPLPVELAGQHREVGGDVHQWAFGYLAHHVASARSPMNSRTWSSAPWSFSATRRRTSSSRPGSSSRCTTSSK